MKVTVRALRIASMGFSSCARAKLRVKVALFDGRGMVGAWEVNSWVKGGLPAAPKKNCLNAQLKKSPVILEATSNPQHYSPIFPQPTSFAQRKPIKLSLDSGAIQFLK